MKFGLRNILAQSLSGRLGMFGMLIFLTVGSACLIRYAYSASLPIELLNRVFSASAREKDEEITDTEVPLPAADEVQTEPVEKIEIGGAPAVVYPGRVEAFQKSILTFRVSGPLNEIYVEPGDLVHKGDKLMQVDPRDYIIQVDLAQSRLDAARAEFDALKVGARPEDIALLENHVEQTSIARDLAEKEYKRAEVLVETKAVSVSDYDTAHQTFVAADLAFSAAKKELEKGKAGGRVEEINAAQANIHALEAQLRTAQNNLSDTTLTAPYDGVITEKMIEVYEMVTVTPTYREVLGIQDISRLKINVYIPEKEIASGKYVQDFYAEVRFNVRPDQTYTAKLYEIETSPTRGGMTYKVTFVLNAPEDAVILPGMSCEVLIPSLTERPEPANGDTALLTVPTEAVEEGCVWVFNSEKSTVTRRQIKCGALVSDDRCLLLSGLTEGDQVVVQGGENLEEGKTVRVTIK